MPSGNIEQQSFDFLVAVLFDFDFGVRFAIKISFATVLEIAGPNTPVNGYQLRVTPIRQQRPDFVNINRLICGVDELPALP